MLFTGSLINLIIIRYLCDVKNRLGIPSVTVAVILAVVLLNIVVFYYTPLYGDDLTYKSFFEGPSTRWTGPLGWLRWLWMHWNSINGRLGNFVIIPLLALPQGLRAVVAAGFLGLFFWAPCRLVARFTGRRAQVATMAMTALLVAGMPWYDSMCLFIGQTNYVWAGAFVIMALLLLMRRRPVRYRLAAALFCAVAGAFHEAAGLPVAVGLVVYNVLNRSRPTDRLLTAFFIAGALFATLSPGIISRAGTPREPDASPLMIALTSDWAVILMLGAAALDPIRLSRRQRRYKRSEHLRGPFGYVCPAVRPDVPDGLLRGPCEAAAVGPAHYHSRRDRLAACRRGRDSSGVPASVARPPASS